MGSAMPRARRSEVLKEAHTTLNAAKAMRSELCARFETGRWKRDANRSSVSKTLARIHTAT